VAELLWIDLGARVAATHGAILGHNLDVAGTIRWSLSDDPAAEADPDGAALAFDATVRAWDPAYGLGFDPFGDSLGGFPDLSDFAAFPARRVLDYGGTVQARFLRIELRNARLDAPIEAGVVLHGQGWDSAEGVSFGWSLRWVDNADQVETEAGLMPAPAGPPTREASFDVRHMPPEAALFNLDDLARIAGRRRPVLVEMFAGADVATAYRTTVYGYFTEDDGVTHDAAQQHSAGWTVRELPA